MILHDEGLQESLDEAMEFQETLDGIESHHRLDHCLDYLGNYRLHGEKEAHCLLYSDFAPYSFGFTLYVPVENGRGLKAHEYPAREFPQLVGMARLYNGGIIFSGPTCTGNGSAPSFSVNLTPGTGWFVHT